MDIRQRFKYAEHVAAYYPEFVEFADDGMAFLGFNITPQQRDIAEYLQYGPDLSMVMAQRGEAKSTVAALYAVWGITQNPSTRVLTVSAGETQATEVATLIVRIITTWDILEYLRPDRQAGDRTAVSAFDVHYALKGIDKSPSVACVGITSNLPGKRADILLPDDIESNKNSLTVVQRQQLLHLTKEFSAINTHGKIKWLGTPQSKDSIYRTLRSRGYDIRVWPGRYPTPEEEEHYNGTLAPSIVEAMTRDPSLRIGGGLLGDRGKSTDPLRYTEEEHVTKELDIGPEEYALQYMLDTTLSDATRQQLRLSDLIIANFGSDMLPDTVGWQSSSKYAVPIPNDFPVQHARLYYATPIETATVKPQDVFMYIDPAGGGVDEIGYACGCAVGPYIHVLECGGLVGGLTPNTEKALCDVIRRNKVSRIKVESNMGHGLFEISLRSILRGTDDLQQVAYSVSGEYSTGQKEKRIIDSLVSPMQRHKVVVHQGVIDADKRCGNQHAVANRAQYSLFYQMESITTDRGSLTHDDRLEAFAGVVREFRKFLENEEDTLAKARELAKVQEFISNPMGYAVKPPSSGGRGTKYRLYGA